MSVQKLEPLPIMQALQLLTPTFHHTDNVSVYREFCAALLCRDSGGYSMAAVQQMPAATCITLCNMPVRDCDHSFAPRPAVPAHFPVRCVQESSVHARAEPKLQQAHQPQLPRQGAFMETVALHHVLLPPHPPRPPTRRQVGRPAEYKTVAAVAGGAVGVVPGGAPGAARRTAALQLEDLVLVTFSEEVQPSRRAMRSNQLFPKTRECDMRTSQPSAHEGISLETMWQEGGRKERSSEAPRRWSGVSFVDWMGLGRACSETPGSSPSRGCPGPGEKRGHVIGPMTRHMISRWWRGHNGRWTG